MTFEELLKFIKLEQKRLMKSRGRYKDEEKEIFATTIKLNEEVGELCEAILFHYSLQGKHKTGKYDRSNLEYEFADILIVLLLLAGQMGVDVRKSLKSKIKKINERYRN